MSAKVIPWNKGPFNPAVPFYAVLFLGGGPSNDPPRLDIIYTPAAERYYPQYRLAEEQGYRRLWAPADAVIEHLLGSLEPKAPCDDQDQVEEERRVLDRTALLLRGTAKTLQDLADMMEESSKP